LGTASAISHALDAILLLMKLLRFALLFIGMAACAQTLKVMSYNVRYPNPGDGPDVWTARRDLLVESIRVRSPDLIGTQELFYEQGQYIAEKLPAYAWFGISRRGNRQDEHMGVFYLKDRLNLIDSGDFWLSETPEKPGSIAWDMSLPRMVTWGLFELKGGPRFLFLNTHFAHRREDERARQMSARLIACRLGLYDPALPIVLAGDFNAPAGGETFKILAQHLKDSRLEAPEKSGPEGTFHGFKGVPGPSRIDWIMFRAPWKALSNETITDHREGRYPSDHFPILAVFDLKP
jgi:endonuclease/exonuclease/phosphatase family metal-dependent hydrolase